MAFRNLDLNGSPKISFTTLRIIYNGYNKLKLIIAESQLIIKLATFFFFSFSQEIIYYDFELFEIVSDERTNINLNCLELVVFTSVALLFL